MQQCGKPSSSRLRPAVAQEHAPLFLVARAKTGGQEETSHVCVNRALVRLVHLRLLAASTVLRMRSSSCSPTVWESISLPNLVVSSATGCLPCQRTVVRYGEHREGVRSRWQQQAGERREERAGAAIRRRACAYGHRYVPYFSFPSCIDSLCRRLGCVQLECAAEGNKRERSARARAAWPSVGKPVSFVFITC